jgi:CRISPR-associated exonuclease Cas4
MTDESGVPAPSVPISALEHHAYCPRQAALIHVDDYFAASVDTVRGDLAHAAVDRLGIGQDRRRTRVWRSLPVWSERLGLHGVCDVVQFGSDGPVPVEHKSGRYVPGGPADLQVAAQVLCLREMFGAEVPVGVVFAGRDRRRHEVPIGPAAAARVADVTAKMRQLIVTATLPPPVNDARCRRCSLIDGCQPAVTPSTRPLYTPRPAGTWDD